MAHLTVRVDPDMIDWINAEAAREHRTRSQMAGVLVIEARQAREAARANGQTAGHPTIPGQTALDVDRP